MLLRARRIATATPMANTHGHTKLLHFRIRLGCDGRQTDGDKRRPDQKQAMESPVPQCRKLVAQQTVVAPSLHEDARQTHGAKANAYRCDGACRPALEKPLRRNLAVQRTLRHLAKNQHVCTHHPRHTQSMTCARKSTRPTAARRYSPSSSRRSLETCQCKHAGETVPQGSPLGRLSTHLPRHPHMMTATTMPLRRTEDDTT